jgi:hypothetical protein
MDIDYFINLVIKGYLFCDLDSMHKIKLPKGQKSGACGYPMLATALAGIELLGVLGSPNTYNPKDRTYGRNCFNYFWDNYMVKTNVAYVDFADFFYSMVRNGLMHLFLTKTNVLVTKGASKYHMQYDNKGFGYLMLDAKKFHKDFKKAAKSLLVELGKKKNVQLKNRAQKNLNDLIDSYNIEAKTKYNALKDPLIIARTAAAGASGAIQTTPSGINITNVASSGTAIFTTQPIPTNLNS